MDEDMLKRLALLKALQDAENHDTPKTQDSESICVSSIRDANILLQMHMDEKSAAYRKRLVSYVTDPANQVRSECNVYHNFIMDLSRCGDFLLALQVCDYALSFAPYNRDMLADAINACAESSQFEKGEKYLGRALEIPKELWSFRLFLYSVSFLKNKLSAYPMDAQLLQCRRKRVLAHIITVCQAAVKLRPAQQIFYPRLKAYYSYVIIIVCSKQGGAFP